VVGAVAFVLVPDARAQDAQDVLEKARNATVREDFSGTVQIEWLTAGEWKTARVPVTGTGGTVQIGEGTRKAESQGNERWIAGVSGWQAGWDQPVSGDVPDPGAHWDLALGKGPDVAGRSTNVVTASDRGSGQARIKVYVDRDTGVMLRREVLDQKGRVVRAVGFVEVKKLGGARAAAPAKPSAKDRAPTKLAHVPNGFAAPEKLRGGYVLAGTYLRDGNVVQLYYSDGLFGVSLFEQRGDLNWNGLPHGGAGVAIDSESARAYEVAGGTVVVWEHDGVTYTGVSDATVADLRSFAAAFDQHSGTGSGLLHRVADFVLGPFGWN